MFPCSVANSSSENSTSNFTMECGSYEQLEYWPNNFDDFAVSVSPQQYLVHGFGINSLFFVRNTQMFTYGSFSHL